MANTITNTQLLASKRKVVQHIVLSSDGSEETDLVVYDSSAVATTLGISDPLKCTLEKITYSVSAASTSRVFLEFDATTDVLAIDCPAQAPAQLDFSSISGLKNTAGSGITGDIMLTTTGLESGDKLMIILEVIPS